MIQGTNTTESYTYDPLGNRLSSLGVSPYSVNVSNQLTSTPSTSYTYDSNGNTLTSVTGSNTTTYAWDFENRLTSVTLPGTGGTVSFKYDPFGRRIYKSSSSGTSIFAYDGDNFVEETNSVGGALARYAQGQNIDEPLAMLRNGTTNYYQADGLGSITSLSNSAGALAQTYTFDSFGKQTDSSGSLTNPFRYTGRELDTETGLYFYRARYFDPTSGRFLSEDPVDFRGGINLYRYVKNNPLNWVDPSGFGPMPPNPQLPTVPTGKAGCAFLGEISSGGKCKTCMYSCRGYGAIVTFPQAASKPCPSIDPVTGLVNTGEIDPGCRPDQPSPPCKKIPVPDPTPFVIFILILFLLKALSRVPVLG